MVTALNLFGLDEILLLLGAGIIGLLWGLCTRLHNVSASLLTMTPLLAPTAIVSPPSATLMGTATLTGLGVFFLKIGSMLYGSGCVLAAFLRGGLVDAKHWLTQAQLLDAVAVGQFTPGLSSGIVFLVAVAAVLTWNLNAAWIVAGGAALGWACSAFPL